MTDSHAPVTLAPSVTASIVHSVSAVVMPPGFHKLVAAQFFSALADNALLIVAIAFLDQTAQPAWWAPMLKFWFTVTYVIGAPVVGPLADSMPKACLMAWMNAMKIVGVIAFALGAHPLLAFAVVGAGAAAYAPAKYGLVTEIVPAALLVRANAWLEVSVIAAVLGGAVLGGVLVGPATTSLPSLASFAHWCATLGIAAGTDLASAFTLLLLVYAVAAILNAGLPVAGVRYAREPVDPASLVRQFVRAQSTLWRDREGGRLSLAVTSLFWGVGAVLQLAVLRYATDVLTLPLSQGAYLQAVVAVGVVAGAVVAGRRVPLAAATRVLPAGIVLGVLVATGACAHSVTLALPLLIGVGAVGGLLLVPMNALLQHRGVVLLTAGRSIAVQGFNENASMLVMLGLYAALLAQGWPVDDIMLIVGLVLALLMAVVVTVKSRIRRRGALHDLSLSPPAGEGGAQPTSAQSTGSVPIRSRG